MNEVILNKKISIERCIHQINQYYAQDRGVPFEQDFLKQDAIAMNLQRICELAIDIANHLIKTKKLGLPQDSRDSFALLQRAGLIGAEQMKTLQAMVGFRNILVHEYQALDLNIMVDAIEHRMREVVDFASLALKAAD
ncbi:MAG: type II toxin-antitoxin system toxin [Methylohalobius crimeensis]